MYQALLPCREGPGDEARPDVTLFGKLKDSEPSNEVLCLRVSQMAAAQQCSLSVCVTRLMLYALNFNLETKICRT